MDLFDIAAKITLNTKEYEEALGSAESKGSTFASKLKSGLGSAAKIGGGAILALGTAVVSLGKKFTDGVNAIGIYGDSIDKNSQKMGISAKAYQEWDFILQHSGSSIDAMGRGMMTLSKQAESNSDAFQKLGISTQDLAELSKEDLFAKTIEGLQALGEGTERDALASELFGGSAKELGPLLNTTADDVAEMRNQVNELGGVMSDDAVKSAAAFQDSLQNLKTAGKGLVRQFMGDFLPSITRISDGLTKLFSKNKIGGLNDIKKGVNELVSTLSKKLPDFIEVGVGIVESIAQAIIENLPMLIEKGADIILNGVLPGILDNLPALIETALLIIQELAVALSQSLPELVPAAVGVILQIVESLLDNMDMLVDAAIALITGLAEGIVNAIPILIEKAPVIISKLVQGIIQNVPKLFEAAKQIISKLGEGIAQLWGAVSSWGANIINKIWEGIKSLWSSVSTWGQDIVDTIWSGLKDAINDAVQWGKDLIVNFWNGIKSQLSWLWDGIKSIGQGIADFLGFSEPKKGPLSNFHTFAPDMMELFMKGINDNKNRLTETVADAFDFHDLMTAPANGTLAFAGAGGAGFTNQAMPTIDLLIDGKTLVGSTREHTDRSFGEMDKIRARWAGDQR